MKKNGAYFKRTALVSALMLATGAQAATINVDGVTCTLPDAITAADTDTATGGCSAGAGVDELELDISGSPFTLSGSLPNINSEVTINGNESTITGDGSSRIFSIYAGSLTLNDVTVENGASNDPYSNFGGGLRAYGGAININRSTITGNTGGGVMFNPGTSGSITDSVIDDNHGVAGAGYYGAAVSITGATVAISNTTISNNTSDSTISGGGGIYIGNYGSNANVSISNTTITGNSSTLRGGGISHYAFGNSTDLSLTNVTLINNTTGESGGGLSNDSASITISQSLISGNTGTGGTEIDSAGGTVTVDDYNLFGLNSTSGVVGVTVGTSDIVPAEATLAEIVDVNLADNGGPTPTHALADGSPAIDAVPAASCASLSDQTGKDRPIDGDVDGTADCDIGAFENSNPDIIFKDGFE